MREGRRSSTSDWVAALRALYTPGPTGLPSVGDEAARSLLPTPLRLAVSAAHAHPLVTRATHALLGHASLGLSIGVPLRTLVIDDFVRESATHVRQLVIVGAGLDARAYRMDELAQLRVFELDHPATQAFKRERTRALSSRARELTLAAIDFERQSLDAVLRHHDFDANAPSLWIWEGVTMYLDPAAVDATLEAIARVSAPGSRLAVTYLPRNFSDPVSRRLSRLGARVIGEAVRASYEPEEFGSLLLRHGFRVLTDDTTEDWASRWPASQRHRVRNWERLARAERV
ncbi:MAG: SAM-dependent methyltransferase [Polyangiaceae bacterium]